MYLRFIATALSPRSFTQKACWDAIREGDFLGTLKPRSAALVEKILSNGTSGIERRHLALNATTEPFGQDAETLSHNFEREAPPLAGRALMEALRKAGLVAADVDALFICTCTGYLCPGVSSHVAE